jgi:UDP-2-acetamido-3-amino-2,3-dideoxy-glucuronate N-acetyltransferase
VAKFVSPNSIVEAEVILESGVCIWHHSHLREKVTVGQNTIIGKSVYVGPSVRIGRNCKIQNQVQIYEPAEISDNVFIGPGVVLTNDRIPRATTIDGKLKQTDDWESFGVRILEGASVGANSTCIAPVRIGKWSMIGAGSVVTKDVANYSLVAGNPARHIAWVGESGERLEEVANGKLKCPISGREYSLVDNELTPC